MRRFYLYCIAAIGAACIVGCDDPNEVHNTNETNLKHPTVIGETADGRTLYRFDIYKENAGWHYVYCFGTNDITSVTDNYRAGKANHTIMLNGSLYQLVNTN